MAVAESGAGIEDKVIKTAASDIYNIKIEKTCGVLSENVPNFITIAKTSVLLHYRSDYNRFNCYLQIMIQKTTLSSPHPRAKDATNKRRMFYSTIAASAPKI